MLAFRGPGVALALEQLPGFRQADLAVEEEYAEALLFGDLLRKHSAAHGATASFLLPSLGEPRFTLPPLLCLVARGPKTVVVEGSGT